MTDIEKKEPVVEHDTFSGNQIGYPSVEEIQKLLSDTPAAAPASTEPVKEEAPVKKHDEYLSSIAKGKQKILAKQKQLSAKEQELAAKEQAAQRLQHLEELKSTNPAAIFDELNIDPQVVLDTYIERASKKNALTPEEVAQQTAEKIVKQHLEQQKKAEETANYAAYEQKVFVEYKASANDFLKNNEESYPLLATLPNKANQILDLATQAYNDTGKVPTIKQICDVLEEQEQNAVESVLDLISSKPFFMKLLNKKGLANSMTPVESKPTVTLTKSLSSGSAVKAPDDMTEEELFNLCVNMLKQE